MLYHIEMLKMKLNLGEKCASTKYCIVTVGAPALCYGGP